MMKFEGVRKKWQRYKYVVMILLIGSLLMLIPGKQETEEQIQQKPENLCTETQTLQTEMESILGEMSGVGQIKVLLTLETDGGRQLAEDTELEYSGSTESPEDYSRRSETVLVDVGSGNDAVVLQRTYPTYRGALVVCQGGGRAEVKLNVTQAVSALTGLPADRITVAEWQ